MTKKIASLIQTVILAAILILLFVPIGFKKVESTSYLLGIGGNGSGFSWLVSDYVAAMETKGLLWFFLLVLSLAASIAYIIMSHITSFEFVKKKYCAAIPASAILFLIVHTVTITKYSYSYESTGSYYYVATHSTEYNIAWGFYIIVGLCIAVVVIELLKQFTKVFPESVEKKVFVYASAPASNNPSSFEGLEKLKELLDKGIITEEEFEAKKKQLLDL